MLIGFTAMLFLILVTDEPEYDDLRSALREGHQSFLDSMARSGRLLVEGSLVDGGSLMVIEAASASDAITVLQGDPYIVQPVSNRVQVRELVLSYVAPTMGTRNGEARGAGLVGRGIAQDVLSGRRCYLAHVRIRRVISSRIRSSR